MSEVRIIKKYPNRRLYDTAISSYITLEDVRRLVLEEVPVKVIDARSQEEITHNTLLQIILEQEEKGPHLFTINCLQEMIQLYGGAVQPKSREVCEQGMSFFIKSMNLLNKEASKDSSSVEQFLQQQSTQLQALQQQWVKSFNEPVKPEVEVDEQSHFRLAEEQL
jgi:polyhydroxyalkanoate synthesis repressor PhaR